MNHIFKSIWSQAKRTWIAVSEIARYRGGALGTSQTRHPSNHFPFAKTPIALIFASLLSAFWSAPVEAYLNWQNVNSSNSSTKNVLLAQTSLGNASLSNPTTLATGVNSFAYTTLTFRPDVSQTGVYFGQTSAGTDTVMILYQGLFDPLSPGTGAMIGNDDTGTTAHQSVLQAANGGILPPEGSNIICGPSSSYCPQVNANLVAGNVYTLFISIYSPGSSTTFVNAFNSGGFNFYTTGTGEFSTNKHAIDTDYDQTGFYSAPTYYRSSEVASLTIPRFAGGTLRVNENNKEYTLAFTVQNTAGNTIDQAGNTATFSGVFSDYVVGQAGSLNIANSAGVGGKVIMTGNNTYTGDTNVLTGASLQIGNGLSSGSLQSRAITLQDNAALIFDRSDSSSFNGSITGAATSTLTKQGVGDLSFTQAIQVGNVDVKAGLLNFNSLGTTNVLGDYTTRSGAETRISQTETYLKVGNHFIQEANSSLSIVADSRVGIEYADITANSGSINATGTTLNLAGLYFSPLARASVLPGQEITLIHTAAPGNLTGTFANFTIGGGVSTADYITILDAANINNQDYVVRLGLSWYAGTGDPRTTGNFTLTNANERFDVSLSLIDEAAANSWNGTQLTKLGAGTLVLSQQNTYSGGTLIQGGTLALSGAGSLLAGSSVVLGNGTKFDISGATQGSTVDLSTANLTTGAEVILGNQTLTVKKEADTTYANLTISGDQGGLTKTGAGTLSLENNNTYTGKTRVLGGALVIGSGATLASNEIENNAILKFQRNTDLAYSGQITGSGRLEKTGSATVTLSGGGQQSEFIINSGEVVFNQTGTFLVNQNLMVSNGARLTIGAEPSQLKVGGLYSQGATSTLSVTVGASPEITANIASLGGTLNITGFGKHFAGVTDAIAKSSEVTSQNYRLIAANSISGNFSNVNLDGVLTNNGLDYLIAKGFVTADNKNYDLGFQLAWSAASPADRKGTFTLAENHAFDVNTELADSLNGGAAPNAGWDGMSLTKAGAGSLVLSARNTYQGDTLITEGTLKLSGAGEISSSNAVNLSQASAHFDISGVNASGTTIKNLSSVAGSTIELGAKTLVVDQSLATLAIAGNISGNGGGLTKNMSGTIVLSGDNTYTGRTAVNAGTLEIQNNGTLGVFNSQEISNNATLIFTVGNGRALDYAGRLSGGGTLQKQGANMLHLSGGGDQGNINITEGGILFSQGGAFRVHGNYTADNGATPVATHLGTKQSQLEVGGTFTHGSNSVLVSLVGNSPDITADAVNLGGYLIISGFSQSFAGDPNATTKASELSANAYQLIRSNTDIVGDFANVDINTRRLNFGLTALPTGLQSYAQQYGMNDYLLVKGYKSADNKSYLLGFGLAWNDANAADQSGTFTILSSAAFDVDLALTNSTGNANWDGQSLTKAGDGILILSRANTYTGDTRINDGTLSLRGAGSIAESRSVSLAQGSTLDITGATQNTSIQNLSAQTDSRINLGANTLIVNQSTDGEVAGIISGVQGSLVKEGSATLSLSAANTYTGDTLVNAGTLQLIGSGSLLASQSVQLSQTGKLDVSQSTTALTLNNVASTTGTEIILGAQKLVLQNNAATEIAGAISGTGEIVKEGSATLTLSGNNSYTGATTITQGTLAISGTSSLANSASTSLSNANTALDITGSTAGVTVNDLSGVQGSQIVLGAQNLTVNQTKTTALAASIRGGGQLIKEGAETLNLSGSNTYTGLTHINHGTLSISGSGSIASSAGVSLNNADATLYVGASLDGARIQNLSSVANSQIMLGNKILEIGQTQATTSAGVISGTGSIIKTGTEALTLTGVNTFTGNTQINAGALLLSGNGSLATSRSVLIMGGGTLDISGTAQGATLNNLSGLSGALVTLGNQTLTLNNTVETHYGGAITGSGTFIKTGNQTLVLSGFPLWTGGTEIQGGTLALEGATTLLQSDIIGTSGTQFIVRNNANFMGTIDPLDVSLESGGRWTMTGDSVIDNLAFDNGALLLTPPSSAGAFKTLDINGQLSGAGLLRMNADLAAGQSDLIRTTSTTGNHQVAVINQGLDPTKLPVAQKLIDVSSLADSQGVFSGGADVRAFRYGLVRGTAVANGDPEDWYVIKTRDPSNIVSSLQQAISSWKPVLGASGESLARRFGDLRRGISHEGDVWMRVSRNDYNLNGAHQTATLSTNNIEIGLDRRIDTESSRLYVGGLLGYLDADTSFGPAGKASSNFTELGGYATWIVDNGVFVDFSARYAKQHSKYDITPLNSATEHLKLDQDLYVFNLSTGYPLSLSEHWSIEPQAGLDLLIRPSKTLYTNRGTGIHIDSSQQTTAHLGMLMEYWITPQSLSASKVPNPQLSAQRIFAKIDRFQDIGSRNRLEVQGYGFDIDRDKGWLLSTGVQFQHKDMRLNAEVSTALGSPNVEQKWGFSLSGRWAF